MLQSRRLQQRQPLRAANAEYFARWYHIPIREMVGLKGFREDAAWIARRLGHDISPQEVKAAIERMLQLGLLQRDANGKLRQSDTLVTPDSSLAVSALKDCHRHLLSKGSEALEKQRAARREISGITIPVSGKLREEMRRKIIEFRREMLRLSAAASDAEDVYQLNIQFFALTEPEDGGES